MAYTHSFQGTTPPPRFDDIPWTRVLIEESLTGADGTWLQIDDQEIPVDATPESADPVSITTTQATLASAFFRFRFDVDPSNPSTPSPAVMSPAPAYAPTVAQVAAILRARTRGIANRDAAIAGEQGTFTTTTRPTYAQVQELIDIAVGDLASMMRGRTPCTVRLEQSAGAAAAYRAAQLVEVGYYPEQTEGSGRGDSGTAFSALGTLWKDSAAAVVEAVTLQCPIVPGTPGGPTAGDGIPIGRTPVYERIGWHTQW